MLNKPHVFIHGKGSPLVLFHGWGFDSEIWTPLLPALTRHYQLYLVDLPGFGLTPHMPWDDFKLGLMQQLPRIFSLIGWSMGGLMATKLAHELPSQVSHLVNIASSPRFIRGACWPGVQMDTFTRFYQDLIDNPQLTLTEFITLQLQGESVVLGHPPSYAGLQAGLDWLVGVDLRESLKELHQPVCYMFGRLDTIVPRILHTTMLKLYPNIHYVLFPKAAHVPFLSHPDEFIKALEEFLR